MAELTDDNSKYAAHVSFDNVVAGEDSTENNAVSFTLNETHSGYQYRKQSRTFLCGVDENSYSDYALQWVLDEMVDDGDQVVGVRVLDKPLKQARYKEEAQKIMNQIEERNKGNRAISITVELAVGKLHTTFQKMASYFSGKEEDLSSKPRANFCIRFKSMSLECL